jgi:hypothetical protein
MIHPSFRLALALASITLACGSTQTRHDDTPPRVAASSESPSSSTSPSQSPPADSTTEAARCPGAVPAGTTDVLRETAPPDVAAIPAYAHVNPSGLASCVVRPGNAQTFPRPDDRVVVQYVGWSTSGVVFDSSVRRGRPATFPLHAVITGWTEGVGMMTPGEIRRLWIPEALAYRGRPGRPAGMLIFDVELIGIESSSHP